MVKKTSRVRYKHKPEAENIKRLYWILGVLSFVTLFIIFFVIGDYGLYQIYALNKQKNRITDHIAELKLEQDSMQAERNRLETDLEYIERLARERYRMAKKGEKVFRVIERPAQK
ncbi:MAG: septum formation initiator family protein [Candidatus Marinimicrobia bacterium]|nr:septum formation initiator family protein [Candidatus Neomarinimicrobiota bacterium]